jgi:hypothetical protein
VCQVKVEAGLPISCFNDMYKCLHIPMPVWGGNKCSLLFFMLNYILYLIYIRVLVPLNSLN